MTAKSPSLALYGGPASRLSAASARRAVLTLPWAATALPGDPWLAHLLPRRDYNTAMLDALLADPPPPGATVALFLADPLLRLGAVLPMLGRIGAAGIAAFPGLSRFRGGFGDALAQAGLSPRVEIARLGEARAAGFGTLAALWEGADWPADAAPPDRLLAPRSLRLPGLCARRWEYPARASGRHARDLLPCRAAPQSP